MRLHTITTTARLHLRLAVSCAIAAATAAFLPENIPDAERWVLAWDALILVFLGAAFFTMWRCGEDGMRARAAINDPGRFVILAFCVAAVGASFTAIFGLISDIAAQPGEVQAHRLGLAVATVAGSWLFLHTNFALHYAHSYYQTKGGKARNHAGGLIFPDDSAPDYFDFLYFSFVIGATAQTSDVNIAAKGMRRVALAHGILAFAFNTLLVALIVNLAANLI